jgi:hypothetical protein
MELTTFSIRVTLRKRHSKHPEAVRAVTSVLTVMWYIEQQLALEPTPNMCTRTPLYVTQADEVMHAAKI